MIFRKPRTMSKARHRALIDYVTELQECLRLQAWDILVMDTELTDKEFNSEANAGVYITEFGHACFLYVSFDNFFDLDRSEQRRTIVHELSHLIMDPYLQMTVNTYAPRARRKADRARQAEDLVRVMEQTVDDYAMRMADHVPLPPLGWMG